MKRMILAVLMAFGASAFAGDNINGLWCTENLNFSDEEQCIMIVQDGYFHPGAGAVCAEEGIGSNVLKCVLAAKNKSYTTEELMNCKNKPFIGDQAECMALSGTPVQATQDNLTAEVRLEQIRVLAESVKYDMEAGNLGMALVNILLILELATL